MSLRGAVADEGVFLKMCFKSEGTDVQSKNWAG